MNEWINRCHFGDCIETMRRMPDGIAQTCVTSPPYFGLRDYGHAGQIGLEQTPEDFIAKLVAVFQEVRRVLRDDGTLWLNIGDSYATGTTAARQPSKTSTKVSAAAHEAQGARHGTPKGCKTKDLIGIPWMLAFALRADGWYLRQDIIWHKPNPMPESVTDRCTKAHESIFLMSKSPSYYCDMAAIREPVAASTVSRLAQDVESQAGSDRVPGKTNGAMKAVGGARSKRDSFKRDESKRAEAIPGQTLGTHRSEREESDWPLDSRNKRSVWTVATTPYKGAHFATFPAELIEPCVLAGAPAGGIVLDPFFGSGTTGQVAQNLGRAFIGCELNPLYESLQKDRLQQLGLQLESA